MIDKKEVAQKQKNKPIKRSILTNMIIVPFIPFILAIGVSFYYFTTALENNTTSSLKQIVADHRDMIESFLMERKSDLTLITDTFSFSRIDEKESIYRIFENLKNRSNAFVDLGLFDSNGVHVRYSGKYPLKGKNYKNELWFKEVIQNGCYISDVFLGYRNIPHFVIAVKKGSGEGAWVVRATIDTLFFERLVSKVRIGKTGESYILNNKGVSQTARRSGGLQVMDQSSEYINFPVPGNSIQTFIKADQSKDKYLYATTGLKNNQWLLVVRQEKKDAYTYFYSALYISLIIMIIGGAVIVIMAVYMTERILKSIEQLGQEKENLGNQLIHAAQLAEVGEMAAGFAHEINNPLQIIKSEQALIEILLEADFDKDSIDKADLEKTENRIEIEDSLDQIKLQVNRCSEITQAILKFGRKNETQLQLLNPFFIVPEIIRMIEKKVAVNGIEMIKIFSKDPCLFMGDPSQFQQVMLNLINNAMDAILERHGASGGILTIESDITNNQFFTLTITDNGMGISPENIEKIFSPFFTTKPVGKGTGLGLSVCHGIIDSFNGTMAVTSEQDVGTRFVIRLPLVNPIGEAPEGQNEFKDQISPEGQN